MDKNSFVEALTHARKGKAEMPAAPKGKKKIVPKKGMPMRKSKRR